MPSSSQPAAAPPQAVQQTRLRPVYSALDNHNFTKALKLTFVEAKNEPACHWDLCKALRAHALERTGRVREALGLLRAILSGGGNAVGDAESAVCWDELDDRILQMDAGLATLPSASSSTVAVAASSSSAQSGGGKSKGKKGKGKKTAQQSVPAPAAPKSIPSAAELESMDLIDLLDRPSWRRRMEHKEKWKAAGSGKSAKGEIIIDDTVLATLKVTLLALRLNETLAQMFAQAAEALGSSANASKPDLCSLLRESYLAHIRVVCTYSRTAHTLSNQEPSCVSEGQIWGAERVAEAYETAQLNAMALARHTGSRLHLSWVANAALLHREACLDVIHLIEAYNSGSDESLATTTDTEKFRSKAGMLSRLAESLMARVVGRGEEAEHPPSAEDWELYVRTLVEQDKREEALGVLQRIECASGSSAEQRRIDDEHDITTHEGSLIQLTHREKLELMASMSLEMEQYDEAGNLFEELITMFPDNWSYWMGLLRSSITCAYQGNADEETLAEGLERCRLAVHSYSGVDSTPRALRGPNLFCVEIAAVPLRGVGPFEGSVDHFSVSNFLSVESTQQMTYLSQLNKAIIAYGRIFAPDASCCFYDLRPYVRLLVMACIRIKPDDLVVSGEIATLVEWAAALRKGNVSQPGITDVKERRKMLRAYIASAQIVFEVLDALNLCGASNAAEAMQPFMPCLDEMTQEWHLSLDLGSNPKDGGQKEVLPGDELILLSCQVKSNKSFLLAAAALLEGALHHSPYNPHLKIAAVNIYRQWNAGKRSVELYEDMGVKQVQCDSCAYLILPTLVRTGLYREAVQLSGDCMSLHWSSPKDVQDFAAKSCETGMLSKCREMIAWQRERMSNSMHLFASKSTVMDLAPLVYSGDGGEKGKAGSVDPLGAQQGLCGGQHDFDRVEEMIRNCGNNSAAPSVVNVALEGAMPNPTLYSDNRDFTVNQFEVLSRGDHASRKDACWHATLQALGHGILMRAVLMLNVSKAPKKGKVVKVSEDGLLHKRCKSLWKVLDAADKLVRFDAKRRNDSGNAEGSSRVDATLSLWAATVSLARVLCVVCTGFSPKAAGEEHNVEDSLSEREKHAVELLKSVQKYVGQAQSTLTLTSGADNVATVCQLLPENIVSVFALVGMAGNLFSSFGWGKRKRHTKLASGALADVASTIRCLVLDMRVVVTSLPLPSNAPAGSVEEMLSSVLQCDGDGDDVKGPEGLMTACAYLGSPEGREMLESACRNVLSSYLETRQRVEPFLEQMIESLGEFDVAANEGEK